MSKYKQIALGRHYVILGYEFKNFSLMLNVNRYGFDIYIYPLIFQFEYHGVEIQKRFEERLSKLDKEQA